MGMLDDLDDDNDEDEEEHGDLKRCQDCGKMWPREDLCYVNSAFGEILLVCPRCACGVASSESSSWNE